MLIGEAGIEQIIITAGYFGIFSLMLLNGIFSFPSSQILYIIAGYFAFTGNLEFLLIALLGALGNTLGNVILFHLAKEKGLEYVTKFTLIPPMEIKKIQAVFDAKGAWFVFFGKLLPAIKVFIPIVAGIGKMRLRVFAPIVLAASFCWSLIFISIGFYFGKSSDVFGAYAILLVIIALIVIASFYKYMNSKAILDKIK